MILEADIDAVARGMCDLLGAPQNDIVPCSYEDTQRPTYINFASDSYQPPLVNAPLLKMHHPYRVERWKSFRRQAALTLAAWKAMHKHALTSM